jgi:two-component system chemotaxis response regulator CheV
LEFPRNENHYGINVAKIREILTDQPITPVPNSNSNVEGIFMPRDTMISVINLKRCLGIPETDSEGLFIITNFNSLNVAFHVDQVIGIHRLSWADIITPNATMNTEEDGVSTGVVRIDGKLVVILDFEKIVTDISPETGLKVSDIDRLGERTRSDSPIMIAEDSVLLSKMITECLTKAGYTTLNVNSNGKEAWDKLKEYKEAGNVYDKVHCIITDIEMPLMDGHRLTKLVKSDDVLKKIPLVIFSSLVNDEMRRKGEALGADAQLTKPEIGKLVSAVDELIDNSPAIS